MSIKPVSAIPAVPLTSQRIFQAALDLLDEGGLDAFNMRALASRLKVKAASLYNHVPHKSALLDGVQSLVFSQVKYPSTRLPWDKHLFKLAGAFRKILKKHPNATLLFASRPSMFSTALVQAEKSLQVLTQAGFSKAHALYLYQSVAVFVLGHALAAMDPEGLEKYPDRREPDGRDNETAMLLPKEQFPIFSAIPKQTFQNTDAWFRLGIQFLLRGAQVSLCEPGSEGS